MQQEDMVKASRQRGNMNGASPQTILSPIVNGFQEFEGR